jgi:hypothetical protein
MRRSHQAPSPHTAHSPNPTAVPARKRWRRRTIAARPRCDRQGGGRGPHVPARSANAACNSTHTATHAKRIACEKPTIDMHQMRALAPVRLAPARQRRGGNVTTTARAAAVETLTKPQLKMSILQLAVRLSPHAQRTITGRGIALRFLATERTESEPTSPGCSRPAPGPVETERLAPKGRMDP